MIYSFASISLIYVNSKVPPTILGNELLHKGEALIEIVRNIKRRDASA